MKFKLKIHGREVIVEEGETIYDILISQNIRINSVCGGKGLCGKCKVKVADLENVNGVTEQEKNILGKEEIADGYRLACLTKILGDNTVILESIEEHRMMVTGVKQEIELDSGIQQISLKLPAPSIEDPISDLSRIEKGLREKIEFKGSLLTLTDIRDLSSKIREGWITCILRDRKLIKVKSGIDRERIYGIALDIGTTTIVTYLLDLEDGNLMGSGAIMNPQIPYGGDIISRLSYANDNANEGGLSKLNKVLIDGITHLIGDVCRKAEILPEKIYSVVAVGNTAMHHLLLRLDTKYLSMAPFTPVLSESLNLESSELGITNISNAQVFIPPAIGGFMGPDHVAVILASGVYEAGKTALVMDIGTNTEISLGRDGEIWGCSTASGPAFEGYGMRYGMLASAGAIEEVEIEPETYKVRYKTIDRGKNERPEGLCGSGIIDLIAELLKTGIISNNGKMKPEIPGIRRGNDGLEFVIAEPVVITQKDIRRIQLAKSAIVTGIEMLLDESGTDVGEIEKFFIAGAFGSYIKTESAKKVGIIPSGIPAERIEYIGNGAGIGAQMLLLSKKSRGKSMEMIKNFKRVELAAKPEFQKRFIAKTSFG